MASNICHLCQPWKLKPCATRTSYGANFGTGSFKEAIHLGAERCTQERRTEQVTEGGWSGGESERKRTHNKRLGASSSDTVTHSDRSILNTHCGWNSTLEGITSGVPLITFPLTSEQFYNEKVAVQLLEIGVRVRVEKAMHFEVEDKSGIQVRREKVREAIKKVMGEEDEESERIRERARNYGEKANKAMEKGASSYLNLSLMIEDITQHFRRRVEDDDSKAKP